MVQLPTQRKHVGLITGAGSGIGSEVARKLAKTGIFLVLVDNNPTALDEISREIGNSNSLALLCDVTNSSLITAAFQALDEEHRPDILVNGVGGDANRISIEDVDESYLETSINHNLTSVLTMTRLCVPTMRDRGWGRIVNFSSIAGRTFSYFSNAAYVAAKAAVIGYTKQAAYELATYGICVNAVAHGPIATGRIRAAWESYSEDRRLAILGHIPLGRLGTLGEAAGVVAYLCSEDSGFTTGAVIDINGGLYI